MTTIIMFSLSYKKSNHDLSSATKSDARETLTDVTAFTGAAQLVGKKSNRILATNLILWLM